MREKPLSKFRKHAGLGAAALGFLSAFLFFQFAYPYHLIKREQANLFVYDGDYIVATYRGMGWLARFVTDFLEQFFHLPVVGPLVVALLITGIGIVVYRILRRFLGFWPSLGIAALVFAWAFLRETGNIYTTRYTVVVLGYLALILAALQFKKHDVLHRAVQHFPVIAQQGIFERHIGEIVFLLGFQDALALQVIAFARIDNKRLLQPAQVVVDALHRNLAMFAL